MTPGLRRCCRANSPLANRLPAGVRPPEVGYGEQDRMGVLQDRDRVLGEIVSDHDQWIGNVAEPGQQPPGGAGGNDCR